MYYYGQGYPYPQGGANYYQPTSTNNWGGVFAVILVLFILLAIIGCGWANGMCNGGI